MLQTKKKGVGIAAIVFVILIGIIFAGGASQYDHIIFTEHFIGVIGNIANLVDYRFARCTDLCELKYRITKDETKVIGGRLYMIDLLNANGKKCLGVCIHGKDKMEAFLIELQKYCPGIRVGE